MITDGSIWFPKEVILLFGTYLIAVSSRARSVLLALIAIRGFFRRLVADNHSNVLFLF
jgi:hypothetical protein